MNNIDTLIVQRVYNAIFSILFMFLFLSAQAQQDDNAATQRDLIFRSGFESNTEVISLVQGRVYQFYKIEEEK